MKKIILFLISILIGITLTIAYTKLTTAKQIQQIKKASIKVSQFSIQTAPKQSLKGDIISLIGDVQWQSRVATQASKITQPQSIQQGENIVTGINGRTTIQFPSVAIITIPTNTEVDFVQTLPADIVMNQSHGTAQYEKQGTTSLSVRSFHLLMQVDGEAAITTDSTYDTVIANVLKGSVIAAFDDQQNVSNVVTIYAGNKYVFDDDNRSGEIQ